MGLEERRVIVACACSGTEKFAKAQYTIFAPNTSIPPVYTKRKFTELLQLLPQSSEISQFVSNLAKKTGKFAFFLAYEENGSISQAQNLLTGRPVK